MIKTALLIHPDEISKKWIDRMADNGISVIGIHPGGGKTANDALASLLELSKTEEYKALIDYAHARGLLVEYELHAMRYLLPESEFNAHPEWFRMTADGERSADLNCCATNSEMLDFVAERAAEVAKALYGSTNRYYFWLDDAKDAYCHCPSCEKLSPSDQQVLVLNRILKRLREDDPEASLAYLAYFEAIAAPIAVKPDEGIFLEYAPFERDFHAPIENDAQADTILALLDCFGTESARVLDYWYDNSLYSGWKKPPKAFTPDSPVINADLEYYTRLGFSELASFACYLGEDYEELHGDFDLSDLVNFIKSKN